MMANRLLVVVDTVFSDYQKYGSAYYIVAAAAFSLYIYADFSAYSDMARGVAKIMGIDVGKNFNNPYLSLSTSEFWNRWHTSLNSWLLENIYIPLGGNRKGTLRKYCNIMIVFLVSGLWHGANYHFIVWGGVNGLFVIVGQMLTPFRKRIENRLHVDENAESVKNFRRVVVFALITLTWVFFHNGVPESVYIIKHMIFFNPLSFFDSNLFSIAGTVAKTFVLAVVTKVFCTVQKKRQDEGQMTMAREAAMEYDPSIFGTFHLTNVTIADDVVDYLTDFKKYVEERGASVYFIAPPVVKEAVLNDDSEFFRLKELEEELIGIPYISDPTAYLFPCEWMSDAMYHCNSEGEKVRTKLLIEDLRRASVIGGAK